MSAPDAPRHERPGDPGATTSGRGTPVAVDLSGTPGHRTTIALFLAGPVIWSLHFLVVYLVAEAGCSGDGPGLQRFDPPVPTVVTLVATAVAALACLVCARWAYRRWRGVRQPHGHPAGAASTESRAALAFGAFTLLLLGVIEVLFVGVPALFLPAC